MVEWGKPAVYSLLLLRGNFTSYLLSFFSLRLLVPVLNRSKLTWGDKCGYNEMSPEE